MTRPARPRTSQAEYLRRQTVVRLQQRIPPSVALDVRPAADGGFAVHDGTAPDAPILYRGRFQVLAAYLDGYARAWVRLAPEADV